MDKLICIGKNYLDHAKELGDAVPEMPVIFLKPPSCARQAQHEGETLRVELPRGRGSVHHECEIVVRLGAGSRVDAVTLGLDMTLRDVQAGLKKSGHPWEIAKVFPGSALLGPWISLKDFPNYLEVPFQFKVNGQIRQKAAGSAMRLSPEACIRYVAEHFGIMEGDAVFTGTPAGVGAVQPGDVGELSWGDRVLFRLQWL